jgi:DNA-binding protein HU-beta
MVPFLLCLHLSAAGTTRKKTPKKSAAARKATAKSATKPATTTHRKSANASQAKAANKAHSGTAAKSHPKTSGGKGTVAKKGKKTTRTAASTWRNRQTAPTPDRYKEIQAALVAKGYLKAESASGQWNQASIEALKRFQAEQNIDANGKINALSIIALGLGPKYDSRAALAPRAVSQSAAN